MPRRSAASYKGKKTGTLGHMAGCSFCQNKTFTTGGEGGMVTTDDEDLAWKARSFRDHGYDVKERLNLLELEQKLPYIHNRVGWNYRMTEMQSAIGLAELERMDTWNMPRRRRNAHILLDALGHLPQVKYLPIDTPERQNGWFVLRLLAGHRAHELRHPAVRRRRHGAEGCPCWKVFWPQCHTERAFVEHRGFGRSGFPFTSKEYADPRSVDYSKVEVPNARWHEIAHLHLLRLPTFSEEDMEQIAAGLVKVIKAYLAAARERIVLQASRLLRDAVVRNGVRSVVSFVARSGGRPVAAGCRRGVAFVKSIASLLPPGRTC